MRFFFILLLTAVASYFALMIMPWWIPMLIGFCLVLAAPLRKNWQSFLATGSGAALCYLLLTITTDQANEHILSRRMATLFHLPSYALLIALTVLIGFLTAGLGGWTAGALRRMFRSKELNATEAAGQ